MASLRQVLPSAPWKVRLLGGVSERALHGERGEKVRQGGRPSSSPMSEYGSEYVRTEAEGWVGTGVGCESRAHPAFSQGVAVRLQ